VNIGNKIKEVRKAKHITLVDLSKKSGVQVATLSRIENLKMTGTLESHMKIAKALGVDIASLYKEIDIEPDLLGLDEIPSTDTFTYNEKANYEILTKNITSKKMMPIILNIDEGGRTATEQNKQNSERFIFVLEGSVNVIIEEKHFKLSKNSSLYFDSSKDHYFENVSNKCAKIISITTPVAL